VATTIRMPGPSLEHEQCTAPHRKARELALRGDSSAPTVALYLVNAWHVARHVSGSASSGIATTNARSLCVACCTTGVCRMPDRRQALPLQRVEPDRLHQLLRLHDSAFGAPPLSPPRSPILAPLPHLQRDWAHRPPFRITGTGLAPATSAPGLGSPPPHLHRDWARPASLAPRTDS
jgi:hypothetical protein